MNVNRLFIQLLIFAGILCFPAKFFAQVKAVPFSEIETLQGKEPRNLAVFIHTSWCPYCRGMENTTFKNAEVVKLLNDAYYFADLDAGEKEDLTFYGLTYRFRPTGKDTGEHELAQALGTQNGRLEYPAFVILNPQKEIIYQQNGFLTAKEMLAVLQYFRVKRE